MFLWALSNMCVGRRNFEENGPGRSIKFQGVFWGVYYTDYRGPKVHVDGPVTHVKALSSVCVRVGVQFKMAHPVPGHGFLAFPSLSSFTAPSSLVLMHK